MNPIIVSETDPLQQVLLAEPTYYEWLPSSEIALESLNAGRMFDRDVAIAQHQGLISMLTEAGVKCVLVPAVKGLPDLCWTRDSSQITPWEVTITGLTSKSRQGESKVIREFYEADGLKTKTFSREIGLEGGDIHIIRPGLLAIGVSTSRTSESGAQAFMKPFNEAGWAAIKVKVPDRFVHLDVLFSMVTSSLAVACTEILDDSFINWLHSHEIDVVEISPAAAELLGCNLLSLGNNRAVVPAHCSETIDKLDARGVNLLVTDLTMYTLAGGGVRCLTQPLRRNSG